MRSRVAPTEHHNFQNVAFLSLWKNTWPFINQAWILYTQGCFVPILTWNVFFGKRNWPFIWINLNFLYPIMLCTKFGWFWKRRWKCEKFTDGPITGQITKRVWKRQTDDSKIFLYDVHMPNIDTLDRKKPTSIRIYKFEGHLHVEERG